MNKKEQIWKQTLDFFAFSEKTKRKLEKELDFKWFESDMYNGIGLQTARGSGTNGYVQRNLGFIRSHKDPVKYKTEEEIRKTAEIRKEPNQGILDHERKRKLEVKKIKAIFYVT